MTDPTARGAGGAPGADGRSSAVALVPWGIGEWALVVQAGSDAADLFHALVRVPAGLEFVAAHGDVDVVLVYRVRTTAGSTRRDCVGAALHAVLAGPADDDGTRWMTSGERQAYRAGRADALAAVRRAVSEAVGSPQGACRIL